MSTRSGAPELQEVCARVRRAVEARLRGERTVALTIETARDGRLRALGLDREQVTLVWACVVATIDPALYPHLVQLGGADGRRGLSIATYAAMTGIDDATAVALATWLAGAPLVVRLGLLGAAADGLTPAATPWRASPRLVAHLAGADALDPLVARAGGECEPPARPRRDAAGAAAVARLDHALGASPPRLVVVEGPRGAGRRGAVAAWAAARDRGAVFVDAARLAAGEVDEAARALLREAALRDAVPVLVDVDQLEDAGALRRLAGVLDAVPMTCVVTSTTPGLELPARRAVVRVALGAPDVPTRLALWRDAVDDDIDEPSLRELAIRYRLTPGGVRDAVAAARLLAPGPLDAAGLVAGVRASLADRFGGLAERLEPTDAWDDVVLPQDTVDQIRALIARVRYAYRVYEEWRFPRQTARGGGVAALLSGPPGTGKTMVAGLIARELGRDLYRVDLARVVSKWVGETEKQLAQIFDAADAGDAVLLFDEADALFAKRTEVKSSSDRYANLEVNYLLQRVESFGGVTILTTNLEASIDPALRRRLAAHVVFWPPEHDERVALWRRYTSTGAPVARGIDLDELAGEFPDMTGANIRNAAIAAAFLAAAEGGAITHDLLVRAARAEYRAMGRVLGGKR